ncbi:hypothetical protein HispidOSU_030801 [Sigmodon hispidus]
MRLFERRVMQQPANSDNSAAFISPRNGSWAQTYLRRRDLQLGTEKEASICRETPYGNHATPLAPATTLTCDLSVQSVLPCNRKERNRSRRTQCDTHTTPVSPQCTQFFGSANGIFRSGPMTSIHKAP